MSDTLIKVEGVSKKFCRDLKRSLWYGMLDLGSELLGRRHGGNGQLRPDEFWAVNNVSFELKRGECLGLIGHNGAGKTTLLRMLNGLIKPDKGRIEMRGRVGALIALGAGFNPVLTGRENIYVNASILGLSKREIEVKIDEIIDFADIGDFIDSPVQNYSSGMSVRLGFAVAVALEPDILLLDEVLAVGDAGFRSKCYNSISKIAKNAAVIYVSHSMAAVSRLANSGLVLENGAVKFIGRTSEAINNYYELFNTQANCERLGNGLVTISKIGFYREGEQQADVFLHGEAFIIQLELVSKIDVSNLCIDIVFMSIFGEVVGECNNLFSRKQIDVCANVPTSVRIRIDPFTLNGGIYKVSALLLSENMMEHYDWLNNFTTISVSSSLTGVAGQQFMAEWYINDGKN